MNNTITAKKNNENEDKKKKLKKFIKNCQDIIIQKKILKNIKKINVNKIQKKNDINDKENKKEINDDIDGKIKYYKKQLITYNISEKISIINNLYLFSEYFKNNDDIINDTLINDYLKFIADNPDN